LDVVADLERSFVVNADFDWLSLIGTIRRGSRQFYRNRFCNGVGPAAISITDRRHGLFVYVQLAERSAGSFRPKTNVARKLKPTILSMQNLLFDSGLRVLDRDGTADYFSHVLDPATCDALFSSLAHSLDWQCDHIYMFGKLITTKRKVAWIGDPGCSYTYSGVQKNPQPWTSELVLIKQKIESISQYRFNSCLLNLYHDGSEGMGWHSDDEPELVQTAPIASVSLGGERKFSFKHKDDKETTSLVLGNGSVLIMHAPTQQHWQHSLTKTKQSVSPRINLTFRSIRD